MDTPLDPIDATTAKLLARASPICRPVITKSVHDLWAGEIANALERRSTKIPRPHGSQRVTNHCGQKRGWMTVLYYSHARQKSGGRGRNIYYLARCICGEYELRTQSALNHPVEFDCCHQCHTTRHLQDVASGKAAESRRQKEALK